MSEKSTAFAKSGASLAADWSKMQRELMAQTQAISALWMGGRVPSAKATAAIIARSQKINEAALASGIRALRPIHATATANQKRLARGR